MRKLAHGNKEFVKEITPRNQDFAKWYTDVIVKSELVDYAPVKGCMVIRPYGFSLWEAMQRLLDERIKATGHTNAYFPLFIPESLLRREAQHVEGFAPEVAWVTHGGQEELGERLAVRPTSEAIIGSMYAKWIQSYRDLPVLINQWCNVVRWEKSTRPFLRTTEFLWQEGHTAHRTEEEAREETLKILGLYRDFVETELAMPVIVGKKSEQEKFAGAVDTYTLEALMADGRALQAGTSHFLGQNFAEVFGIMYLDEDHQEKYVWQTSWGVTTRLIGAIIMCHGDDRGLVLPPRVAPIQVVIVPIFKEKDKEEVLAQARKVAAELKSAGLRVMLDDRDDFTPGWKFNEWEMRGVPLRLEIGPRDLKRNQVFSARRDSGEKQGLPIPGLPGHVENLLGDIQRGLYEKAKSFLLGNIRRVETYDEFRKTIKEKRGFIKTFWCGNNECEDKIKEETGATIRCIVPDEEQETGKCLLCGETGRMVYFARAY